MKIYIHHDWNKSLFYKMFHNTTNINLQVIGDKSAVVECTYNNQNLNLVFDRVIHDNSDGYHLIDWFSIYSEIHNEQPELLYDSLTEDHDLLINTIIYDKIKDKKNWIISILRTEKIYTFEEEKAFSTSITEHQNILHKFSNEHNIVTDNFYLIDVLNRIKFHHVFTNTIFQWNSIIDIRWFYEFKQVFDKLNFDYDLGFSVRNPKKNRIKILKGLSKLNNDKIFLQITDFKLYEPRLIDNNNLVMDTEQNLQHLEELYKKDKRIEVSKVLTEYKNINRNKIIGDTHFSDLSVMTNGWNKGLDYDLFFRYLSKAKIQVLDESWAWYDGEFNIQYLSEKTIGYILAGVPFITTNPYPLQYLKNELGTYEYPFYNEVKNFKGKPILIVKFIETFMNDYDKNYMLLKQWTDDVHFKFMERINSDNSLLNLILNKFNDVPNILKNKSLL